MGHTARLLRVTKPRATPIHSIGFAIPAIVTTRSPIRSASPGTSPCAVRIRLPRSKHAAARQHGGGPADRHRRTRSAATRTDMERAAADKCLVRRAGGFDDQEPAAIDKTAARCAEHILFAAGKDRRAVVRAAG